MRLPLSVLIFSRRLILTQRPSLWTFYFKRAIFIFVPPALFGAGAIWFAMPLTELLVTVYVLAMMRRCTAALPKEGIC